MLCLAPMLDIRCVTLRGCLWYSASAELVAIARGCIPAFDDAAAARLCIALLLCLVQRSEGFAPCAPYTSLQVVPCEACEAEPGRRVCGIHDMVCLLVFALARMGAAGRRLCWPLLVVFMQQCPWAGWAGGGAASARHLAPCNLTWYRGKKLGACTELIRVNLALARLQLRDYAATRMAHLHASLLGPVQRAKAAAAARSPAICAWRASLQVVRAVRRAPAGQRRAQRVLHVLPPPLPPLALPLPLALLLVRRPWRQLRW